MPELTFAPNGTDIRVQTPSLPEIFKPPEQPQWQKKIEETRQKLSQIVDEQGGRKLIYDTGVQEAKKEGDQTLEKQNRAARQVSINELTGARNGFETISQFETHFRMKPALDAKKSEIQGVVSSLEKRIANKQFAGMSQMELGQQLEEERRMLTQVDTEIDKTTPDVFKDESILNKKGFWTDARKTSNDAIRELIKIAKGESTKPVPEVTTEPQQQIVQEPVSVESVESLRQPEELKIGETVVNETPVDRITQAEECLMRDDVQGFIDINLTIEEVEEFAQRKVANIRAIGDTTMPNLPGENSAIIMEDAIAGGFQTALTGIPIVDFLELRPEQKDYRLGMTTGQKLKEFGSEVIDKLKGITGKRLKQVGVSIATLGLLAALKAGPVSSTPFKPIDVTYPPTPTAVVIPETPTPPWTATPTKTPEASPTSKATEAPTETPTAVITPPPPEPTESVTQTPEEPTPIVQETRIDQEKVEDPYEKFFNTPITINGTFLGSFDIPDEVLGKNWINPENNIDKKNVIKHAISEFLRYKFIQEGRSIDILPDGTLIYIAGPNRLTEEEMNFVRKVFKTNSVEEYQPLATEFNTILAESKGGQ